jgi:hypothetical protein
MLDLKEDDYCPGKRDGIVCDEPVTKDEPSHRYYVTYTPPYPFNDDVKVKDFDTVGEVVGFMVEARRLYISYGKGRFTIIRGVKLDPDQIAIKEVVV